MKKQLFLIVFLAFFAGISAVNAQCVSTSGFTPSATVGYTYVVTIPGGTGYNGSGSYRWYVTQDVNILTGAIIVPGPGAFFDVNVGAGLSTYNTPWGTPGTTNSLRLTWDQTANGQTFYLVLRYSELNLNSAPGCDGENIRVWQIMPNVATNFLLAITGSNGTGDPLADAKFCAGAVAGAFVTPNPDPLLASVHYTYDPSTLYYLVTASGEDNTWTPSIQLPDISVNAAQNQEYGQAQWAALTDLSTWYDFTGTVGTMGGDFTSVQTATVTTAGTSILIRVPVVQNEFESLADQLFLLGVDGTLPSGQSDINGGTGPVPDPCAQAPAFAKQANYTILARPTVNAAVGMDPFITKLP